MLALARAARICKTNLALSRSPRVTFILTCAPLGLPSKEPWRAGNCTKIHTSTRESSATIPATTCLSRSPSDVLARGRERFNIYCAPCHSRTGDGNGMIVQRGFRAPPSYHTERLRKAPLGYFFDVMTEGFGAMPEYASQIPARDRWTIVAYIRALQLSQEATMSDVPPGQKVPSVAPVFRGDPGSGATLPELETGSSDERGEQPK